MTTKVILELNTDQVEELVGRLPINEKIRLIQKLEQETWPDRLDDIVAKIRKRFRQNPISNKEITRICEDTRQRIYNERNKGRN